MEETLNVLLSSALLRDSLGAASGLGVKKVSRTPRVILSTCYLGSFLVVKGVVLSNGQA